MITIQILENTDIVRPTDYLRPLIESPSSFGESYINEKSTYGGNLINHFKWVKVASILGECWFNKPVEEIHNFPPIHST
jgi:hypothetical protein